MSEKPRSSPRPDARVPSLSPRTWRAAAPTFSWAAIPTSCSNKFCTGKRTCRMHASWRSSKRFGPTARRTNKRASRPADSTFSGPSAIKTVRSTNNSADVMNKQRGVIYQHRRAVLGGSNLKDDLRNMMDGLVDSALNIYCPAEQYPEEWDIKGLAEIMHGQFGLDITEGKNDGGESLRDMGRDALLEDLRAQVRGAYDRREQDLSSDLMHFLEKNFMLQVIDHHW